MGKVGDVAVGEGARLREWVVGFEDNDELVVAEGGHGQAVDGRELVEDAEVGEIVGDSGGDAAADVLFEMNVDVGILLEEGAQGCGEEFDDRGDVGEYPDMPAGAAGVAAEFFVQ